jgi:hypothetical protein
VGTHPDRLPLPGHVNRKLTAWLAGIIAIWRGHSGSRHWCHFGTLVVVFPLHPSTSVLHQMLAPLDGPAVNGAVAHSNQVLLQLIGLILEHLGGECRWPVHCDHPKSAITPVRGRSRLNGHGGQLISRLRSAQHAHADGLTSIRDPSDP